MGPSGRDVDEERQRPDDREMRPCLAPLLALAVTGTATGQASQVFRNHNGTFQLEVPANWRQLAPNEARTIGENAAAPTRLCLVQPRHFYAVGPVDAWLAGDFTAPWLYVVEQQDEWFVGDDFAADLQAMWENEGKATGHRHRLSAIRREKVGVQGIDAVIAERVDTAPDGRPAVASLDVHTPAGGQQITLVWCSRPEDFSAAAPGFLRSLASLKFARPPRAQQSLGDRLWTPLVTGGLVALVLLVLYKHTRGRRGSTTSRSNSGPGDLPAERG